ncbi:MAG: hypothetical protein QOH62_80 [Solirubrobacteraceae bacterium]|jgi:hypothetical protein|nr:hypothetical protein [Solirubrobacteraceae bacterium]
MSARALALAAALSLPVSAAFAAGAQAPTAKLKLSRFAKGASGMTFDATFGLGADGKPRILTDTKLTLPTGTKFNTKAIAQCAATADQLNAAGGAANACPPASELGTATAEAYIGDAPDPLEFTGSVWNYADEMLIELDLGETPAYYIDGVIKANTVDYALTLAESLNARATKVSLKVDNAGTKKKPYLRMPPACPKGKWTARDVNTFSGGATETVKTTVPCKKTKKKQ